MGLLDGKKGLVIGLSNYHSLAWGIARALHDEGADLGFTYRSPIARAARPAHWPPTWERGSSRAATCGATTTSPR